MSNQSQNPAHLRDRLLKDLRSLDNDARGAFEQEFGGDFPVFADATATALDMWNHFRGNIKQEDERHLAVSAIAFAAINLNLSSYKLFMFGHTIASGSIFRNVLEGISLASLCSAKSLPVLGRFIADQYSTKNAVLDLQRYAKEAHVRTNALKTVVDQYKFYHHYAHLTKLNIVASASISLGGLPILGSHFDPEKLLEYRKEARSRLSFAKILPNFMAGISSNVAEW